MRLLFYKSQLAWPPRCGGTVHTGNLVKSLAADGHAVTLVTEQPIEPKAAEWLTGVSIASLASASEAKSIGHVDHRGWLTRRLANYWGYQPSTHLRLTSFIEAQRPDAMVAVGLETLPYLDQAFAVKRIWYPADDPTLHAISLIKQRGVSVSALRQAAVNVAYQRAFRHHVDSAWVVSPSDQKWMRRTGGFRQVDLIPNGVDASFYAPSYEACQQPESCVFWGRLDFAPNVDALTWFLDRVWPKVILQRPAATFHVCGSHPQQPLQRRLTESKNVQFHENLDDLRPTISAAALAVFPMVSGAGVKNKVLEAAAMAKPICASARCLNGLNGLDASALPPFRTLRTGDEWVANLLGLWADVSEQKKVGDAARRWVLKHHSWKHSASAAAISIERPSDEST